MQIVFVCYGNICRSPMAEIVFKKILAERGKETCAKVFSRGTSNCVAGNKLYEPAKRELERRGIAEGEDHRARQISSDEIRRADLILVMDSKNLEKMRSMAEERDREKIMKLGSFSGMGDIDDPWYTRDFERTFDEIKVSCEGLYERVEPLLDAEG